MNHNYPKNRKCPDNTLKADLLSRHEINEIFRVWYMSGMYKAAEILETSPMVIHYLAIRNNWTRPLPPHLLKAYNQGTWTNLKTNFINPNQSNNNVN